MLIVQLRIMLFDKVLDRQGLKISVLTSKWHFTLCLRSFLRKTICQWTDHVGVTVYGCSWEPMDNDEFKVFLGVVIFTGVYKSKNKSVAQLWSTLDDQPIFNHTMRRRRYQQFLRFSDLTMHSQNHIISPLTSCKQSEKWLKLGTLTCVFPTLADQAWQWTNSWYALEDGALSSNTFLQNQPNTE